MSRVGKLPVTVPAGVDVSIKDAQISVKGAGGTLHLTLNSLVTVVSDAGKLNFKAANANGWGYCGFGKVVDGTEVVDKIKGVRTGSSGFHQDVPKEDVIIERAEVC